MRVGQFLNGSGHFAKSNAVRLVRRNGHRRKVILNLDRVSALGLELGTDVDARRFRGNIYFKDAPAWSEFDWLDQKLRIGEPVVEVIKRTRRCAATNVNPDTAARDLNLPRALQKGWGHTDLGVYARVVDPGEIRLGDQIIPV